MNTPLGVAMVEHSPNDLTFVERQLHKSVEHFRALIEHASDLIAVLAADGLVRYVSPSSKRVLGYAQEEWVGVDVFPYVHPDDESTVRAAFSYAVQNVGSAHRGEFRFLHRDGSWRILEAITTGSHSETGDLGIVMNARDISERVAQTAALRYQALHDALTDLPNRTLFHESLQQAILNAQRYKKPLALLLLDLDRFREINDTFGHHWGDTLLQQVGERLRGALRKSDPISRLGGDEFAVLLPNTGDQSGATRAATRILNVLERAFVVEGHTLNVGASIGIALFPEHGEDLDTLMRRADIAMYAAKRTSGGFAFYQPEQDHHSPDRLLLVGELRQAIENDHLVLHYQPKACFETGRIAHVEALVRWRHPQRGLVPPDQFIPLAEQTGLIRPLCLWVLNAALRQCAHWRDEGIKLHVAVNLSMRNLHDPHLPDAIMKILSQWRLDPTWLEVEITESALAADPTRALEILTRLSDIGVRISIDDFGTGYSSLAYLKRLPADEIKIDKSFVLGMAADENDAAIVRSTIDLGHNLGLKVVAEGIEDQATWDLLESWGCDFAQGYFLSRPLPAPDFASWLHASSPHAAPCETTISVEAQKCDV
jgi:diguanylate cyclase (GGDEF)-like protein/PAS domain S-box-containing protein